MWNDDNYKTAWHQNKSVSLPCSFTGYHKVNNIYRLFMIYQVSLVIEVLVPLVSPKCIIFS